MSGEPPPSQSILTIFSKFGELVTSTTWLSVQNFTSIGGGAFVRRVIQNRLFPRDREDRKVVHNIGPGATALPRDTDLHEVEIQLCILFIYAVRELITASLAASEGGGAPEACLYLRTVPLRDSCRYRHFTKQRRIAASHVDSLHGHLINRHT